MLPQKPGRPTLKRQLAVSLAMTGIVLLSILITVNGSQNIVIAFSAAVVAMIAILHFIHDESG